MTKHQAERLVGAIDTDACFEEVLAALRWVLEQDDSDSEADVLREASRAANWPATRVELLLAKDPLSLADVAAELSEMRSLLYENPSAR